MASTYGLLIKAHHDAFIISHPQMQCPCIKTLRNVGIAQVGLSEVSKVADQAVGALRESLDDMAKGLPALEAAEAGEEGEMTAEGDGDGDGEEDDQSDDDDEEEEKKEDFKVPEQSRQAVRQSYLVVVELLDALVNQEESSGVSAAERRERLLRDPQRYNLYFRL